MPCYLQNLFHEDLKIEVIHQKLDTRIHHISKHQEEMRRTAAGGIFDELVWKCDETPYRVFEIIEFLKLKLRREMSVKIKTFFAD